MKPLGALTPLLPILVEATTCTTSFPPPTATLDSGPIFGQTTELPNAEIPVNKFLGIPYAAPPVRFAKAQKPEPWTTPFNTSAFGPSCRQLFIVNDVGPGKDLLEGFFNSATKESEDCLFLNAFAPSTPGPPAGRPVVLFIHGGGWQQGDGRIDMSGFAAYEDIVAFTFNYRTNIFGFPNSPVIDPEETNLGLFDQQLAIQWVQDNAAAFGGDPRKVTIWGESAGSLSVDAHVNAYGDVDPPPFRGAIMFSGQMSVGLLGTTASPQDTSYWETTAKVVGCNKTSEQLECMRNVPADDLIKAMSTVQVAFLPINDNITLPSNRTQRWRKGENAKVPVLMGTIAQEGRALVNRNINMTTFNEAYLAEPLVTRAQRKRMMKAYENVPGLETEFDKAAAIYTDFFWQCPQAILANISASIDNPTWRYYFNTSVASLLPKNLTWLEKFHGTDVTILFTTPTFEGDAGGIPLTPQLYTFANYLRGVVGRFVRNPQGGPGWPKVGSRYHPVDIANLGDVGDEPAAGVTVIKGSEVDGRCELYKDIYPLIEQYVINM